MPFDHGHRDTDPGAPRAVGWHDPKGGPPEDPPQQQDAPPVVAFPKPALAERSLSDEEAAGRGAKSPESAEGPPPPPQHRAFGETRPRATEPSAGGTAPNPVLQSAMLLLTMLAMLAAARYAVPSVVEEMRYAWHRGELRAEYETGTEGLRNVSLEQLSQAYQMVTSAVGPSVVHIDVERGGEQPETQITKMFSQPLLPRADQGSGVIVDADGYVLTNRHVIAGGDEITVTLSDGRAVTGQVVGTDALTDLAVLKVNGNQLMPIQWGDSDRLRVGSPVWAVGSPFGLDRTVTFGILSGKHRMVRASTRYQDFMQSDVAVNPGNSGGPLVNARGELVGINTAIVGETYQGVSFSIPSNVARRVYKRLRETGRVERGWLGVALAEVPDEMHQGDDPRTRGALVTALTEETAPAGRAGLRAGDLVVALDQEPVVDMGDLMRKIGNTMAGSTVQLGVLRDDERLEIEVELGSRPDQLNGR